MLRLVAPVLAEQFLALLVGTSDRFLTGHYLEATHIAAITSMAYIVWTMHGVFSFIAIGATSMVARFVGAKNHDEARHAMNQSLLIGAAVAAIAVLFWVFGMKTAIGGLQLEPTPTQLAIEYLRIILPSIPMIMLTAVAIACWRGAGDMKIGLVVMSIVNLVNLGLSWALVLGLGPFPELGWKGVAIGTSAGYIIGGLLSLALLIRGRSGLKLQWRLLAPDLSMMRRLLRIGLPGGLDMASVIGCQLWFLALINMLGTLASAAHGVALVIESLAFVPGAAFQMAAMTMTGQYLGANQPHKASRSVWMALAVGGGFMSAMGVLFFLFANQLPWLFLRGSDELARQPREQVQYAMRMDEGEVLASPMLSDASDVLEAPLQTQIEPQQRPEEVADEASRLLRIISLAMPFIAGMMILNGGLRGAGDTRWPLAFSLIGLLGVRITLTYWLAFKAFSIPALGIYVAGWSLGVQGAWIAMAVDVMLRATMLGFRFRHDGWKRIEV